MKTIDLCEYLAQRAYPGRGILFGRSPDGISAVIAYFIMGRSENSRNRVFVPRDGGIVAEAFDPALLSDPSLILYAPVKMLDAQTTIVTNGDQTETLAQALAAGETFEAALATRTFEPDAPHFTPRISGLLTTEDCAMGYRLSILKSDEGDPDSAQRFFFHYPQPKAGEGHLIHTYREAAEGLLSFEGEPVRVALGPVEIDTFAAAVWNALDMQNRVSLFVRTIDLTNGLTQTRVLNQKG